MIGEFSKEADQRTSQDIDGQSAKGKLDTLAQLLRIAAQEIAKDRSDEPACADEKEGTQSARAPKWYVRRAIVLKSSNRVTWRHW